MQYTVRYGVSTHSNAGAHCAGLLHAAYCPPLPVGPEQIGIPACCGTQCLFAPQLSPGFIGSQFITPDPVDAAVATDDELTDELTDDALDEAPLPDELADDAVLADEALTFALGPEETALCWHCPWTQA